MGTKNVLPALEELYDELWVYGMKEICDPFDGLDLPATVKLKTRYTGYLKRHVPTVGASPQFNIPEDPFILITAGGGGDGEGLMEWVLRAYEYDSRPAISSCFSSWPIYVSGEASRIFR